MTQTKDRFTAYSMLRWITGLAVVDGLICITVLLFIPSDSQSVWLLGYSRARILMLIVSTIGICVFAGLFLLLSRLTRWAAKVSRKVEVVLLKERPGTFVVGVFLSLFVFVFMYLVFAYTNLDYRVPSDAVTAMEQIKAYLYRLAPFALWCALLSGQILIVLTFLGYGTQARYYRALQGLSIIIFPLLLAIFWGANKIDPYYYVTLTKEDNLVEWASVIFFLLAGCLSFFLTFKSGKMSQWFYIFFGIACIFFALEEVSWGQRVFELESTQFFMENSDQQEINVHNVINEWFSIRTKHIAAIVFFTYGAILPSIALNHRVQVFIKKLGILIPPLVLVPGFALASFLTIDLFFTGQDEEVAEFFFSLLLFLTVTFQLFDSSSSVSSVENL